MVVRVPCDLPYRFSVGKLASQVMADGRNVIDGHNQLWCLLVGFEKLEWDGLVEQVITIWYCGVRVKCDICSCEWLAFTADNFELPWININSSKSNEERSSIFP
jgi:hypothetical protein